MALRAERVPEAKWTLREEAAAFAGKLRASWYEESLESQYLVSLVWASCSPGGHMEWKRFFSSSVSFLLLGAAGILLEKSLEKVFRALEGLLLGAGNRSRRSVLLWTWAVHARNHGE